MAKTTDYTKMVQDMMGAFPMDMSGMENMMKSSAEMGEKFSKVALEAAGKSTEISNTWTKDTLSKVSDVATAKKDPADYSKAMTDFASTQAEATAEYMSAFAEVAKKVQMDTVELMLAAGKDMGDEASAAVKKATDDVTKATKKAASA